MTREERLEKKHGPIKTVSVRPTLDSDCGRYKLVVDGIYWSHWFVGITWYGEKFVAEACGYDGLPR